MSFYKDSYARRVQQIVDAPPEVAEAHEVLRQFYGEAVRPVSHVCDSIGVLIDCMEDNDSSGAFNQAGPIVREHGRLMLTLASKSNLLGRLCYLAEPLRTVKCPKCNGHVMAHGLSSSYACGCQATGWLPAPVRSNKEQA